MKDRITIQKIINYINEIEQYVKGMNASDFFDDKKTMSACAFAVSQIGELVGDVSDEIKEKYTNIPWKSIKGMRNRIVHDYDSIDLSVLWNTIIKSLPELKEDLKEIVISENELLF